MTERRGGSTSEDEGPHDRHSSLLEEALLVCKVRRAVVVVERRKHVHRTLRRDLVVEEDVRNHHQGIEVVLEAGKHHRIEDEHHSSLDDLHMAIVGELHNSHHDHLEEGIDSLHSLVEDSWDDQESEIDYDSEEPEQSPGSATAVSQGSSKGDWTPSHTYIGFARHMDIFEELAIELVNSSREIGGTFKLHKTNGTCQYCSLGR
jgi:hypothetical protein